MCAKLSGWLLLCFFALLSVAEEVTISDGDTLRQYLCPSSGTLPPNTHLVLSEPLIIVSSGVSCANSVWLRTLLIYPLAPHKTCSIRVMSMLM